MHQGRAEAMDTFVFELEWFDVEYENDANDHTNIRSSDHDKHEDASAGGDAAAAAHVARESAAEALDGVGRRRGRRGGAHREAGRKLQLCAVKRGHACMSQSFIALTR